MKIFEQDARDHLVTIDIISGTADFELPDHAYAIDHERAVAVAITAIEAASGMGVWSIAHEGCDIEGGIVIADCYVASLTGAEADGTRRCGELRFRLVHREPTIYRPGYITRCREATQALSHGHRFAGRMDR